MKNDFEGVRIGRPQDEDTVYGFLLALHSENGLSDLNEGRARSNIRECLDFPNKGVVGAVEKDGKIVASIGLKCNQSLWYSNDWFLEEQWNFVLPEYRKSDYAKRLIEFAKWSSFNTNAPLIMGIVTKKKLEAKMRLYQRQMPQVGAYFIYGKKFEDMYEQRKFNG